MNSLQPPRVGPREFRRSPDDLDGVIRAFFLAHMPEPWPVLKPPATPSLRGGGAAPRRPSLLRSRFTLAASLLILLIGQLFVLSMSSSSVHFTADSERGKLEARNRPSAAKPREPKASSRLDKAKLSHPPGR